MKNILRKIIPISLNALLFVFAIPFLLVITYESSKLAGIRKTPVPVVGTGSMYPSLFWETSEGGPDDPSTTVQYEHRTNPRMYRYIPSFTLLGKGITIREIQHGDMVSFRNDKTREILKKDGRDQDAGFIKRVIGLPGDIIEIRAGFVIRNGQTIEEPYIYKPKSTYGGVTISDCSAIRIERDSVLVLGDNRKLSTDSRSGVGLVKFKDISFILPFNEQEIYQDLWRDTSQDSLLIDQPTLDDNAFYQALNQLRNDSGSTPLTIDSRLTTSARLRGEISIKTNDFSTEATRSGYTMQDAISDAGYNNIVTGEFISHGYFTAEELLDNLTYFLDTKSQIIDSKYDDIGVSAVIGEINGCPTQVIIGHLGGYIPAQYDQNTINSWLDLRDNLVKSIPSWEKARDYKNVNQEKLEDLLEILNSRRSLAEEIYTAMIQQQWLTDEQKQKIEQDNTLADQANTLIQEINTQ